MGDHERYTSVPPQWRQQRRTPLLDLPACVCIDIRAVHDMSCRTHGVLDQCTLGVTLCGLIFCGLSLCCAHASQSDDSLVRTTVPCALAHTRPTMSRLPLVVTMTDDMSWTLLINTVSLPLQIGTGFFYILYG